MTTDSAPPREVSVKELELRFDECISRIGVMCSDGRPPKMSIPVQDDDDDIFISRTISDTIAALKRLERAEKDAERYKNALIDIEEYWNRSQNESAMRDACWHTIDVAHSALAAAKETEDERRT